MKKYIFFIIGLIFLIGCSRVSWNYYYNSDHNFRMKYPVTWTLREDIDGAVAVFISPPDNERDKSFENVSIIFQDLSDKPKNLEEYTDVYLKHVKLLLKKMKIVESGKNVFAKIPAYRLVYELEGPEGVSILTQIWTIKDNKAFILTGTCAINQYEKFQGILEGMIRSFIFTVK